MVFVVFLTNGSNHIYQIGSRELNTKIHILKICLLLVACHIGPSSFSHIYQWHEQSNKKLINLLFCRWYLKFSCSCEFQLRKTMNKDLQDLFTWLCANLLSLNVAKTEFIISKPPRESLINRVTLKLNGKTLYESKKIKYLGLIVDDRLSWKFHINKLC